MADLIPYVGCLAVTHIDTGIFSDDIKINRYRCSRDNGCPAWKCNQGKKVYSRTQTGWIWKTIRKEEHVIDTNCPLHHTNKAWLARIRAGKA